MAVVAMQKVAILAMRSLKEELLEILHEEGVLEVREARQPVPVDHTEVAFRAADLRFAIETLKTAADQSVLAIAAKPQSTEEITRAALQTDVRGIVDALQKLEESDTAAERDMQEAEAIYTALEPWMKLPYALDAADETANTRRVLGTLPESAIAAMEEQFEVAFPRSEFTCIGKKKNLAYCIIHIWKADMAGFEEYATNLGWTAVELPVLEGKAAKQYEEAILRKKEAMRQKEQNAQVRTRLSVELPNLINVARFMRWLDEKQAVREAMSETETTFTLLGWMPRNRVAIVESKLQKISRAITLLKVKPDEGEDPPVALKNSRWLTPFESVTTLYGLPLSSEADPTSSLSLFFIFFFALCLTDAGYGLVLALIFGIYLFKNRKTVEEARLPWLLFFAGIVTFFVSIPFGGWFGITPESAPAIFTRETAEGMTLYKGQVWNLTDKSGINFLMYLSLILGITHIFYGIFLAGWYKVIHGKFIQAFWQDFTSHLLLGSAIFLGVTAVLQMESLRHVATLSMYASIALLVWGKGYGSPWYLRPLMGALGFINFCISLLSNGLSYLRIMALGLVTGSIAGAINQVAVAIGNLFPIFLAIPIIIVIFLGGHLVSIALNTLGSFIHSGRLQFIEFFSQFFEGGGKAFAPFRRTTS
ncbi:MAG: V-type ATPase 116kDa subunit family protein [Candidatus Peribacteraceae bacterium]|nr:V-type ATPase 116kDa subunit family protein [Candidatus Peribacteraceae bacterium]